MSMYVCMYTYISKSDPPICLKLGVLVPWNQKKILETSKLRKFPGNEHENDGLPRCCAL
jgi:hypothetical protein